MACLNIFSNIFLYLGSGIIISPRTPTPHTETVGGVPNTFKRNHCSFNSLNKKGMPFSTTSNRGFVNGLSAKCNSVKLVIVHISTGKTFILLFDNHNCTNPVNLPTSTGNVLMWLYVALIRCNLFMWPIVLGKVSNRLSAKDKYFNLNIVPISSGNFFNLLWSMINSTNLSSRPMEGGNSCNTLKEMTKRRIIGKNPNLSNSFGMVSI